MVNGGRFGVRAGALGLESGVRIAVYNRQVLIHKRDGKAGFRGVPDRQGPGRQGPVGKPVFIPGLKQDIRHADFTGMVLHGDARIFSDRRHALPVQAQKIDQDHAQDIVALRGAGVWCFDDYCHVFFNNFFKGQAFLSATILLT